MVSDAREHLAQKCFGVVAVNFRAAQQAVDRRRSFAAGIAAGEEKVLAPNRNASQRAFRRIVIDLDASVVANQRVPTRERIAP